MVVYRVRMRACMRWLMLMLSVVYTAAFIVVLCRIVERIDLPL